MEKNTGDGSEHEEHQYLNLIRNILANGEHRPDRYETDPHIFMPSQLLIPMSEREQAHSLSSPPLLSASHSLVA